MINKKWILSRNIPHIIPKYIVLSWLWKGGPLGAWIWYEYQLILYASKISFTSLNCRINIPISKNGLLLNVLNVVHGITTLYIGCGVTSK